MCRTFMPRTRKRGFIVMEDLGDTQYLSLLKTGRGVDKLYGEALTTLANIQVRGLRAAAALDALRPRAARARAQPHARMVPRQTSAARALARRARAADGDQRVPHQRSAAAAAGLRSSRLPLAQSHGASVRDKRGPGVIDFQDALRGPIGYDLVSLLKDCYISWSRERVERWVRGYRRVLGNLGANVGDSEYQFMRWFDVIGVQRHVKVLGIFARLWHRDGKIGYLADLPLVLNYVLDACRRYPELVEFGRWLEWRVAPELPLANARQKEKPARRKAKPKPKAQAQSQSRSRSRRPSQAKAKAKAKVRRRKPVKAKSARVSSQDPQESPRPQESAHPQARAAPAPEAATAQHK